jgi:hypothetical protein
VDISDDAFPVEGSWTHSFEEDEPGVEVFRPTATFAFPPTRRGRKRLTFTPDGVIESAPGPDDRNRPVATWVRAGGTRLTGQGSAGDEPAIDILEASPEVLRLRRG